MAVHSPPTDAARRGLAAWHDVVDARHSPERAVALLEGVLAEGCVFRSPILYQPQPGRDLTQMYLAAALLVLGNETFSYVREVAAGADAVLEFVSTVDGVEVNGVDMLHFDAAGRIDAFTVMVRPRKAVDLVQRRMAEMLAAAGGSVASPDAATRIVGP